MGKEVHQDDIPEIVDRTVCVTGLLERRATLIIAF
jgi:hypothetical protein